LISTKLPFTLLEITDRNPVVKTIERQNNFNLVRLVLALLVLLAHSPELVDGDARRELLMKTFGSMSFGGFAVGGFFLLSGYLIMQSWDSQPEAWAFLKKRLLRIYPGFIVASLVCAFVVGPLASESSEYFTKFDGLDFIKGIVFLGIPVLPTVFEGTHFPSTNGSMWTIALEFSCYLLILLAGVTGILRMRNLCIGLTATLFLTLIVLKLANIPILDLRLFSYFLSGACYYMYRDSIKYSGFVAISLAAVVCACMFSWRGADIALASIGGYVFLYAARKRSAMLSQFNRLPDVSYGAYLYGWPIQKLLLWYIPSLSPWALFVLAVPASLLAGTISWYLVEKPALRFKGPSLQVQEAPKASGVY
jgi:peptidoglycan/LPS O-acetylase OafA/YrhL